MSGLDRQQAERGHRVVSLVDRDAATQWGAWAASQQRLSLIVDEADPRRTVEALLAAFPWPRTLAAARRHFATVAGLPVEAVDAALDGRGDAERWNWILDGVGHDPLALVSGWLLTSIRDARRPPPVTGARLLACAAELAAPVAILLERTPCTRTWFERALESASELATHLPRQPIAVAAPRDVVQATLAAPDLRRATRALALEGLLDRAAPSGVDPGGVARSRAERALHDALARDRRTARRFALNVRIEGAEVDLLAAAARLVVEIDGWYHFQDPERYRRDRRKDLLLQQRGYLVMRYLADDVDDRLAFVVDEIAIALGARENGANA